MMIPTRGVAMREVKTERCQLQVLSVSYLMISSSHQVIAASLADFIRARSSRTELIRPPRSC